MLDVIDKDIFYRYPPYQPDKWDIMSFKGHPKLEIQDFFAAQHFIGFNYGTYTDTDTQWFFVPSLISSALKSWNQIGGFADMSIEQFLNQLFPNSIRNEDLGHLPAIVL